MNPAVIVDGVTATRQSYRTKKISSGTEVKAALINGFGKGRSWEGHGFQPCRYQSIRMWVVGCFEFHARRNLAMVSNTR